MQRFCPECGEKYDATVTVCPRDRAKTYLLDGTDPWLGRRIDGRFSIVERLGEGGMGAVYRAQQLSMDRDVAIKLLHTDLLDDENAVRRFFREARAASRLTNPHTITLFDFGQDPEGLFYIAMELLRGRPMSALLDQCPLEPVRACRLVAQVLEALEEAHAAGVLHRDLKPDNLFVLDGPTEFVKVLDFGIAKVREAEDEPMLTQNGQVIGTPKYMSPEQALGKPLDARSDLYSLGLILFELVAGRLPHEGESSIALLVKRVHHPAPSLREVAPDVRIPAPLEALLDRLLASDPAKRPGSAAETRALLAAALRPVAPAQAPSPVPPPVPVAPSDRPTAPALRMSQPQPRPDPSRLQALLREAGDTLEECRRHYEDASSRSASEPGRRLFEAMAGQVRAQLDGLRRLREADEAGRPFPEEREGAARDGEIGALFEELSRGAAPAVRADAGLVDRLQRGIALERGAVEAWDRRLQAAADPRERRLLLRLSGDAKGRVGDLAEVKLRVLGLVKGAGADALYANLARLLPVRKVRPGEVLFRQGDAGDRMVVVVSGRFRVDVDGRDGQRTEVGVLGPGDVVGEMTCLDPAPRSATVTALGEAEVCELDRGTLDALRLKRPEVFVGVLRVVVSQLTERIRETDRRIERLFREMLLMSGSPFAVRSSVTDPGAGGAKPASPLGFTPKEISLLGQVAAVRRFAPGAFLCHEGEPGRACFIVVAGELEVVKTVGHREVSLAILGEGSVVGQMALVDGGPRSASVRSRSEAEVLVLDRVTFETAVASHMPLALRLQEQVAISGIRQLRVADRRLVSLRARKAEVEQAAITSSRAPVASIPVHPAAPSPAAQALASSAARPSRDDEEAMLRVAAYMRTALREWGMSYDELDEVRVVVPAGAISHSELKARRMRVD